MDMRTIIIPMIMPISIGILLSPLSFFSIVSTLPAMIKTFDMVINTLLEDELKGTSVKRTIDIGIIITNKAIRYNIKFKLLVFIYSSKPNLLILISYHSLR